MVSAITNLKTKGNNLAVNPSYTSYLNTEIGQGPYEWNESVSKIRHRRNLPLKNHKVRY